VARHKLLLLTFGLHPFQTVSGHVPGMIRGARITREGINAQSLRRKSGSYRYKP
jgi:hypothetical protein